MVVEKIKVSFCLPVFNVEDYIKDCIDSIENQNIKDYEYEILCVDDCSSDDSFTLLSNISSENIHVKIFKNACNKGVSYTRNKLIQLAQGEYIWFVDPDDMLYPGAVNVVLQSIESVHANVLLGNYVKISGKSREKFKPLDTINIYKNETLSRIPGDSHGEHMCAIWAGLFKRSFLLDNNLTFNENMIAQEDTLFYYEFSLRTKDIYSVDKPLYIYRLRYNSVMHTRDSNRALKYYYSMREMYRIYKKHLDAEDYRDREELVDKLAQMKQNLALTVSAIKNSKRVRLELYNLKKEGLYPYKKIFFSSGIVRRFILSILPYECGFWLIHICYKIRYILNDQRR